MSCDSALVSGDLEKSYFPNYRSWTERQKTFYECLVQHSSQSVAMECNAASGDRNACSNHGGYCISPIVGCICDGGWTGKSTIYSAFFVVF
jgi:hypothetical protein